MKISNLASHHAQLYIGDSSSQRAIIDALEKKYSIHVRANADFISKHFENFTIDDARELIRDAELRPIENDSKRFFVIAMNNITIEAQNALLKLLEEPPTYAHFYFIVPSLHMLLPTMKSRMHVIENEFSSSRSRPDAPTKDAESFIQSSAAERLEFIKKLMDDISKEKKTKQDAINFLNDVQAALYSREGAKKGRDALESIETARTYMNDRAPSMKMLLEYVALSI